ncbi:putative cell division control protein 14, SIN component [Lyophyllum shimeji]|uniref:Cell division control protein 14, SIN component n=1 Tax=Lyophyllum shimeji TaxID=47721 RepID=A0A9P3PE20_LYOSH|nr:putative cell division control protein 14, SIN component [Lyophyllum shimeji]
MGDRLREMRDSLLDALDELSSARSSPESKSRALNRIERHIAQACVSDESTEALDYFNALQYTFECNVPLRLLAWISTSTITLESLTNKGPMDHDREAQASALASQLALSLSLIQGVALNHPASKTFLGRKYALEVLIDLFLASRHLSVTASPSKGTPSSGTSRTPASEPPLSSVVLDTLLCLLVDSSPAFRAFEDCNGVQAVVRILKRAGTPREVRMKCLEFLYFYLLDETPTSSQGLKASSTPMSTPPATAPATPARPSKPFLSSKPLRPSSSRLGSDFSFPSLASSSSTSSVTPRSTSGSSTNSLSSASSNASGSTAPSSLSSSPERKSSMPPPKTPPSSPPLAHRLPQQLQPRSLMMLRKEFDYEPQSPKKAQVSRLGVGGSTHTRGKSLSRSRLASGSEDDCQRYSQVSVTPSSSDQDGRAESSSGSRAGGVKTTEEKREFLGTMLGNVDALVEGVRKAGIWGLG